MAEVRDGSWNDDVARLCKDIKRRRARGSWSEALRSHWMSAAVTLFLALSAGGYSAYTYVRSNRIAVPSASGLTLDRATRAITDAGLLVGAVSKTETNDHPPDWVIEQHPVTKRRCARAAPSRSPWRPPKGRRPHAVRHGEGRGPRGHGGGSGLRHGHGCVAGGTGAPRAGLDALHLREGQTARRDDWRRHLPRNHDLRGAAVWRSAGSALAVYIVESQVAEGPDVGRSQSRRRRLQGQADADRRPRRRPRRARQEDARPRRRGHDERVDTDLASASGQISPRTRTGKTGRPPRSRSWATTPPRGATSSPTTGARGGATRDSGISTPVMPGPCSNWTPGCGQ